MSINTGRSDDLEILQEISEKLESQLESGIIDLPLLPAVAAEVLTVTRDEKCDISRLTELIHRDQSLAGHLLRVVNSPAYLPVSSISSLQQAIARLGMCAIAEIAIATSLKATVFSSREFQGELKKIWSHSIASGTWGKEIARMRRKNVESAFLCALLHQVGKPVILQAVSGLAKSSGIALEWSETNSLIEKYYQVGGQLLAEKWKLPGPVVESISLYNRYSEAKAFSDSAMMTNLADLLATHLLDPESVDEETLRGSASIVDLNLYPDDLDVLLEKRQSVMDAVEAMAL